MYQKMYRSETNKSADIAAKKAEVERRLHTIWAEKGLLDGRRTKYGYAGMEMPLPAGMCREDLDARKVTYVCTELRHGAVVHLFIKMDPDAKDWGSWVVVDSPNRNMLKALDEKLGL